jgi:secreted PhoX family phosphatase
MTEDRHYRTPAVINDEDDSRPSNLSAGPVMSDIVGVRLSRRAALKGLMASAAVGALSGGLLAAPRLAKAAAASTLTFKEIPHAYDETIHAPEGYATQVMIRWGDKVLGDAPEFDVAKQSAAAQAKQFGYNCDYVKFLPLPTGSDSSDHGLLFVSHEYTNAHLMFPGFADEKAALEGATAELATIEIAAHGASIVEVKKQGDQWQVVPGSEYNVRLTGATPMEITGPAAGHDRLKTSADPTGKLVLGTLNNCSGGSTPWGTVLTAEENFHGYFGGDPKGLPHEESYKRVGIKGEPWYAWGKYEARFDVTKEPNEPNRFGWVVEFDPYDPSKKAVKKTALGRFKHEAATCVVNQDGRLVVYSGDDERFEYVYRYVSNGTFDPAKGKANSALLDDGTLSVAKFDAEGNVTWMPLVHGQGKLTEANGFASQADVLIDTRRAADLLEPTKMDRPEDIEANPVTGKVYVILTKNDKRKADQVDATNARAENLWGQILELVPPGEAGKLDHAAESFKWDAFILAGDPKDAAQGAKYGEGVTEAGWFANPDNMMLDAQGRLWIATDGFPDHGIHDGIWITETEGEGRAVTKHFFGCPKGAELCGPELTPDGQTLFVAVQHPGDEKGSNFATPSTRWPDFADNMPPRPSIVVITKQGGGMIGS